MLPCSQHQNFAKKAGIGAVFCAVSSLCCCTVCVKLQGYPVFYVVPMTKAELAVRLSVRSKAFVLACSNAFLHDFLTACVLRIHDAEAGVRSSTRKVTDGMV